MPVWKHRTYYPNLSQQLRVNVNICIVYLSIYPSVCMYVQYFSLFLVHIGGHNAPHLSIFGIVEEHVGNNHLICRLIVGTVNSKRYSAAAV